MANFYKPKLVCIARCKNEIHIIKQWYESLPFVDLFCITDNNSTDGTYEYLKSLDNVLVTRVEGFHEGRDFQILLKMAKAHEPEWILKIDCDEIFEDIGIKNFHKLLDQKKFDSFFFRKFEFDYRLKENECKISKNKKMRSAVLFLVRNKKEINILKPNIHTGSFIFYKKPALSNFRIKHYSKYSEKKAWEKYNIYNSVKSKNDKMQDYSGFIEDREKMLEKVKVEKFETEEERTLTTLKDYGVHCLLINNKNEKIISPKKNKKFFAYLAKQIIFKIIITARLNDFFWRIKSKTRGKKLKNN